ncbi:MAG TPA: OmpA family protein [Acetobacteraceae bacterium]|nr:OmpA family protein [Acetobacteraceae bacterium]
MRRVMLSFLVCFIATQARADDLPVPKYVVFFQQWSAKLEDPALTVITHAADYAKAHPRQTVHVNAFADPTGSRRANILLTDLRAVMVMDQLQADGVPNNRIIGRGHGSVQFALTSQESRRVEISVGGR